ncbi:MAG TPA: valine--tRNA ligase [Bacteroidaceae bacterium]|nr:valine--tRNA ligase [Bacteroidaceae bacterium]
MELASKYDPSLVEERWYNFWINNRLFHSEPDGREPYTIIIPPPNVTGVLHMGHMLNNTIQDILVRRARMMGKNALWVPGTDHASIATEAKVVNRLASQGIKKADLTRDEFLKHAWEWKEEHGGIILSQLQKLGCSCDWERTAFTMDDIRSQSVIKVFCDLYNKGLIYRGVRMVNWDPKARTAISDEEVIYKEEQSKLYYLKYYIAKDHIANLNVTEKDVIHKDLKGYYAIVATTRPETIMGDTAMCINPDDPKNQWLKGVSVIVPLVGRIIPVIEDTYVDIEFGTGCLKVTPSHDMNDYMLGKKYNLESIDIFNDDGTLSNNAGLYVGMDRNEVKKQIVIDLEKAELLETIEDYTNKVGYSERNPNVAIEPKLSTQWFVQMEHLAKISLTPVMEDKLKFFPVKYKNIYRHWLENIKDWCISRQLWWGHRIPAYYMPDGDFVVAENIVEAEKLAREKSGNPTLSASQLKQDEDVLDTWFSSWLWPITLFDGINNPNNREIDYYYPTNDLVTAPDIIFFWVARMIMAGYEYRDEMPFRNVYFTGIVRDKFGRKMSKSLGNSPDPIDLIKAYGADGVRMGLMLSAPAGNDIPFDETICEQGRNFNNKIWNAFRLTRSWEVNYELPQPHSAKIATEWFENLLNKTAGDIDSLMDKYRINEALMAIYKLFRDQFASWYLEIIKPYYGTPIDGKTYNSTLIFFEKLLLLLHPFMPFITEELWQNVKVRNCNESIMTQSILEISDTFNEKILYDFEICQKIVGEVRNIRAQKNIALKEKLTLESIDTNPVENISPVILKMANIDKIEVVKTKSEDALSFMVGTSEFALCLGDIIDVESEITKLQADLARLEKFLQGITKKLNNKNFVTNAPQTVVKNERKKMADTCSKIATIKENILSLRKK